MGMLAVVLLASLLGCCTARSKATGGTTPAPSFSRGPTGWDAKMIRWQAGNKAAIDTFNAHGGVYDFVQYGDSLTRFLQSQGKEDGWAYIFSGMQAAAYGVPGHGIEDLTWRLMKGGELPAKPPRVLTLLIGCVCRSESCPLPAQCTLHGRAASCGSRTRPTTFPHLHHHRHCC